MVDAHKAIAQGCSPNLQVSDYSFTEKDLIPLEKQFLSYAREKFEFKMRMCSKKDAVKYYKKENNPFKLELIENLKDGEISFCDHADFTDLCKGPHIPSSGKINKIFYI